MVQGLQMLCGVVLLAVITVGQTWGAEAIDIRLQSGTPLGGFLAPGSIWSRSKNRNALHI